jgi:hypothetical protein
MDALDKDKYEELVDKVKALRTTEWDCEDTDEPVVFMRGYNKGVNKTVDDVLHLLEEQRKK